MTLFVPQWATNLNYSTGPDVGTPTKVDPSSIPNGFVQGVIAAPQHVNFLVGGLSKEIVKAIDGVGGGTYELDDALVFDGDEVQFAATGRVLSGGFFRVDSGGSLILASGATVTLNAALDVNGNVDLDAAATLTVHGEIALATSGAGELSVASGAIINVNSGGRVDLNTGSELNVEGTAHVDVEGSIEVLATGNVNVHSGGNVNLESGADLIVKSGANLVSQAGGSVTIEDSSDLVINDAAEGWRLTMTTAFHDGIVPWSPTTDASGLAGWVQSDVAARRRIMFALPIPPGDTVSDVFVRLSGDPSGGAAHGGVLPTNVPTIELVSVDINGAITVHATKDDPTAGVGYDAAHNVILQNGSLTSGAMPHVATADPLYVRVRGEQGGSAVAAKLTILSVSGNAIARSYRADNMVR